MKTKPITLILTLLFCLNGSVFAENYSSYKPFNEFNKLHEKIRESIRELAGIRQLLDEKKKLSDTSQNIKNSSHMWDVAASMHYFHLELNTMSDILKYESVIINENIKNKKLINTHKEIRSSGFTGLNYKISQHKTSIKKSQIEIDNATAVVAINNYLKKVDELEQWHKKNKTLIISVN